MKKRYLIIDVEKCENCNNCFLACKDEHCGNDWPGYAVSQPTHGHRWMNILRKERGRYPFIDMAYLPKPCFHCDPAPCMAAVPDGTIYRREDGIVIIDPVGAKGRKEIVDACPYGALWWNEEEAVAQKCTFCAHLLDREWKAPRCVQACPTGALTIHAMEDPAVRNLLESGEIERPPHRDGPGSTLVYYRNLHRFTRVFIAGSVAWKKDAVAECADGATVELHKEGKMIDRKTTDAFGDFKFDGLVESGDAYTLHIRMEGYPSKKMDVNPSGGGSIGTIWL